MLRWVLRVVAVVVLVLAAALVWGVAGTGMLEDRIGVVVPLDSPVR